MFGHHLFVKDSALIRVFCLDEDGEFPEKGPKVEANLRFQSVGFS
jgi:hypothetical protein